MKFFIKSVFLLLIIWTTSSCDESFLLDGELQPTLGNEEALRWMKLNVDFQAGSQPNSPTYASRALAYAGITMYECVQPGSAANQSIATELNGLGKMPNASGLNWLVAMSAGQKAILEHLFPHAPSSLKAKVNSTFNDVLREQKAKDSDLGKIEASEKFGRAVAEQVIKWAKKDGGHKAYQEVVDTDYRIKNGEQYWVPPIGGQFAIPGAMHPNWGGNRSFVTKNKNLSTPEMIPFSADKNSVYYKQMYDVYLKNITSPIEKKEMAIWWSDDPSGTASPPGHSVYLAMKLAEQNQSSLYETAQAFAMTGIATADAFIQTWKCKYKYHSQRPTSYIRAHINSDYFQFWPEPPFPAFVSGHSCQIASAVTALQGIYGDNQQVTDNFNAGHPAYNYRGQEIQFKPRSFTSLWSLAEECGLSRIYGGIHMAQDNEEGLKLGKQIGQNVAELAWKP